MKRLQEAVEHEDEGLWCEVGIDNSREASVRFGVGPVEEQEPITINGPILAVLRTLEEAALRLRVLIGGPECGTCVADRTVVVQVTGGGAYLARKPAGVAVAIEDFDALPSRVAVRLYGDDITVCDGEALPAVTELHGAMWP